MTKIMRSGTREVKITTMAENAARAASGFVSLGIGPDDVVAVYLRNDFAFFEASVAAGLVGAYSTPINWHNSPDEAAYIFENSSAKVIVIHADLYHPIARVLPEGVSVFIVETPPEIKSVYKLTEESCRLPQGIPLWNEWLSQFTPKEKGPDEPPGTMIYTSGTTGRPKGVRRNRPNAEQAMFLASVIGKILGFNADYGKPEDMVTVVTGPMYHSAPNAYELFAFRVGASAILQPRFDPEELLMLIEKRRCVERAGLISPGDIGYIDEDGFLYLCDRAKDMIISSGVNIYPAEIEAELHKMPGVNDCAVFGIPDDEFGEKICAVVQKRPGATIADTDVRAFLRERMASYKVPKHIKFHTDLPREDSGKIFKRKLREPFWAAAGRNI